MNLNKIGSHLITLLKKRIQFSQKLPILNSMHTVGMLILLKL